MQRNPNNAFTLTSTKADFCDTELMSFFSWYSILNPYIYKNVKLKVKHSRLILTKKFITIFYGFVRRIDIAKEF